MTELAATVTPRVWSRCVRWSTSLPMKLSRAIPGWSCSVIRFRDPGNLGTVIRCADAFGADAVLVSRDSVDVYNAKTVRATTGSLFHLPLAIAVDPADAVTLARKAGCRYSVPTPADPPPSTTWHDQGNWPNQRSG